jgi:cytosine/adenosine deaminase-related metal-dependent hydrolase
MLSRGIVVGIGVDGGASNDSGDMLGELRTGMMVHRIEGVHEDLERKDWLTPKDVFRMATRNGAEILNRNDIGSLEVGKAADIILIDISDIPYAGGLHDPLGALVYCGCSHIVDTSIVNGQFVVRKGRLSRISQELIASKANEISARLLARVQRKRQTR